MVVDPAFWAERRVLVTGHTGFKGAWLCRWLSAMGAHVAGLSDEIGAAPCLYRAADVGRDVEHFEVDVRDRTGVARVVEQVQPDVVLHLAAQAFVRRSYAEPVETYATNVMGTVHLLEAVRASTGGVRAAVVVTSDKCYENREHGRPFVEDDPMGGHDPYSNSKGAAELVTSAYRDSFFHDPDGTRLASGRAGNVIGGGDWGEDRLIPDMMRGALVEEPIPIRRPDAIRPWQHVLNPLSGYLVLAQALFAGQPGADGGFNFGPDPDDTQPVRAIVERITARWPGELRWEIDNGEHPHEAGHLTLDSTKAHEQLGWAPAWELDRTLDSIVEWFAAYRDGADMRTVTDAQIEAFVQAELRVSAVSTETVKYADLVTEWLEELGYTHCFFVAGGNIMHLLDGMRKRMTCVPFVHEVAAGIAAETFNASEGTGRAFALVTAGPGLTNVMTAIGGAWLESHELLVLGGQVKVSDLARGQVRQRGIQEIDGRDIAAPVCKVALTLEEPIDRAHFTELVEEARTPRKGPVFLEFPLDVQGAPVQRGALEQRAPAPRTTLPRASDADVERVRALLAGAERPVLLIGGGVSREAAHAARDALAATDIPVLTTWNGIDRVDSHEPFYYGRPNTWGQRAANIVMQSADVLVALGTRLGLQQTGFNWQEFVPGGTVVQVELDQAELDKGHPRVDVPLRVDADDLLPRLLGGLRARDEVADWRAFCDRVKELLPLADPANEHAPGYLDPYDWTLRLSELCTPEDVIAPCSSGGSYTVTMQAFQQRAGQSIVSNKGSASMGYGLSSALGAALAHPGRRVVHLEGDGGFAQNLQELAIAEVNRLPLKMFVMSNEGYASIRMTQRNYFDGGYLGCDTSTGLGFPDWVPLFTAFRIPAIELGDGWADDPRFQELWASDGPAGFIVRVDPNQTYFPKISSRVTASGSMESNPLHRMSPDLPAEIEAEVLRYLPT